MSVNVIFSEVLSRGNPEMRRIRNLSASIVSSFREDTSPGATIHKPLAQPQSMDDGHHPVVMGAKQSIHDVNSMHIGGACQARQHTTTGAVVVHITCEVRFIVLCKCISFTLFVSVFSKCIPPYAPLLSSTAGPRGGYSCSILVVFRLLLF